MYRTSCCSSLLSCVSTMQEWQPGSLRHDVMHGLRHRRGQTRPAGFILFTGAALLTLLSFLPMALPGQAVVSIEKVTAQYNDNPRGEGIEKLADRDNNTKYLTFHRHGWVLMQAAGAHEVNSYEFVSANDAPERDPMSWSLYGSNDRITWSLLDRRNDVVFQSRRLTTGST